MRTLDEIRFRGTQELGNLLLRVARPRLPGSAAIPPPRGLPDAGPVVEALRPTPFAREIVRLANAVLSRRFPLLATEVETAGRIRWRRDYLHGAESGTPYFRRVPFLDFQRVGDHKVIWELNRHQHLITLAQAFRFTGRRAYLEDLQRQLDSWMEDNPWLRGINWASALEVAFRALSWMWVDHLAGAWLDAAFRRRWLEELYRHGAYLARNLSVYFSPNTHLLGEALALHAVGRAYPAFPSAGDWERRGAALVRQQMFRQVRADGSHFEQSTYYHLYALDMFLLHAVLAETPPGYRERLAAMAEYLDALLGPGRRLPLFGDDDGGRLFHPYGPRDCFARATLSTAGALLHRPEWIGEPADACQQAAWWLGPQALPDRAADHRPASPSRWFPDAGMAVMSGGELHVAADAGPFGPWSAGHSHADTLHFVARTQTEELLIDPGTYTYVADPAWRDRFRGNAAHNTVRIDEIDRPAPAGTFGWQEKPAVQVRAWASNACRDYLDAVCRTGPLVHRRRLLLLKPALLFVLDDIEGLPGERLAEQFWHCGEAVAPLASTVFRIGTCACLVLSPHPGELAPGWRSAGLGHKEPAPVVRVARTVTLPCRLAAVLDLNGDAGAQLAVEERGGAVGWRYRRGPLVVAIAAAPDAVPVYESAGE